MDPIERFFCALLWSSLFLNSLVMVTQAQFECGEHGRFEYCIDGIPGCVVGCHCHPGYYFDTDTKICEPNAKLTKDYRRHYSLEPTRIPLSSPLTQANLAESTPASNDIMNKNVDAITNDVDDLGDWLYSQFFKTIENQVINNTDTENKTRKSGSHGVLRARKPKKSSHRKHSSKKKLGKKGLRRKLLRITEDDSLFDSGSGSSSGSTTSDHSSSSSTDSDCDSSEDEEKTDSDHGRRKIIMYSKKPTPPLPSFIFLPNIETPFYPPIGLPPPPVVPMYPMAPIPPMYPGTKCDDAGIANNSTTEPSKYQIGTSSQSTVTKEQNSNGTETSTPQAELKNNEQILRNSNFRSGDTPNGRSALLHKLREKMKRRYKTPPRKHFNEPSDILESLHGDDSMFQELLKYHSESNPRTEEPEAEDVNFKYLSQLIHRPNRNKTRRLIHPKLTVDVMDPKYNFRKYAINLGVAVDPNNQVNKDILPKLDEGDNLYYTKLGRQIASLIRRFDPKGESYTDIERRQQKTNSEPVFNENNFTPRSFWERSVRSALNDYGLYTEKLDYVLDSSEQLISLEEHVNFAASTKPTLTLQELENMVHFINRNQKNRFADKLKKASAKRLDINLLPAETNNQLNLMIPKRIQKPTDEVTNIYTPIKNGQVIQPANIHAKLNKINHQRVNTINTNKTVNTNVDDRSISAKNFKENLSKTSLLNFWNKANISPLHRQVSKLINNKNTPHVNIAKYPPKIAADKYNNWNYNKHFEKPFFTKNNHLEYDNTYQVPVFPVPTVQRKIPTSYFHHEVHHFDYFD